ncbi:MAG: lamin tail domain-containing protein [Candidatus Paceibacterota bacterium]
MKKRLKKQKEQTRKDEAVSVNTFLFGNKKIMASVRNIVAIAIIVGMNTTGLTAIGSTVAYYTDNEDSTENAFIAGSVDFLLSESGWTPTTTVVSLDPGSASVKNFFVDPQDSNPFQYYVETENFSGDADFCTDVTATLTQDSIEMYTGPLDALLTGTTTNIADEWDFEVTTLENHANKVCEFDVTYNGWQTRHDYETYENGGYSDTETLSQKVASWGFRINKVYYDVAPDRGSEGVNEWVEIYNQTNTPLDISGWEICDNSSCDILPTTPPIPAQEYAVIVATSTTFSNDIPSYWYLPSDVTEIVLDSNIGNGLSNTADMLVLKRPDGVIVDQMNWGTPDLAWANYNTDIWNPGVEVAEEGNVLARVPSGFDTDSPSDWTELEPPSVDLIYPNETGSYTWYWGYSYTITWNAVNHNGQDEDLNMSLFYFKDVNQDSTLNEGDTKHTIAGTTANDGSYTWMLPSGFTGYIWIYLVATAPENPGLNSGTISAKIYDPIPLFIVEEGVNPEDVDVLAPEITLYGNNPAYLEVGSTYVDLGAAVDDDSSNNLGYTIEGDDFGTATTGTHVITYTATDSAGNIGTAERTVVVYDPEFGVPSGAEENETSEEAVVSTGGSGTVAEESEETSPATTTEEVLDENTEDGVVSTTPEVTESESVATTTATTTEETSTDNASSTEDVVEEANEQDETATTTEELVSEDDEQEETNATTEEVLDTTENNSEEETVEETATTTEDVAETTEEESTQDEETVSVSDEEVLREDEEVAEEADTDTEEVVDTTSTDEADEEETEEQIEQGEEVIGDEEAVTQEEEVITDEA